MKVIGTLHDTFGPFQTVEVLSDRYLIDGNLEMQFDVIGQSQIFEVPEGWVPPSEEDDTPGDAIPDYPEFVTRRQAMLALMLNEKDGARLIDLVPQVIAAIPDEVQRRTAEIYWKESLTFQRDEPLIKTIGAALGLSDEDIRLLFVQANNL